MSTAGACRAGPTAPQADTTCRQRGAAPVDTARLEDPPMVPLKRSMLDAFCDRRRLSGLHANQAGQRTERRARAVYAQLYKRMTNYAKFVDSKFIVCTAAGHRPSTA
jgi:hypothetical protein